MSIMWFPILKDIIFLGVIFLKILKPGQNLFYTQDFYEDFEHCFLLCTSECTNNLILFGVSLSKF